MKHFLLLFLVLPLMPYAQPKRLVLIIDTLDFQDQKAEHLVMYVRNNGPSSWEEEVYSSKMHYSKTYPNLTVHLELKTDSSLIELPLDKNGSYLQMQNAYSYKKDTMIINKLIIYSTTPADSSVSVIHYTRKINGELAECAYKVKIKKSGSPAGFTPPKSIPITINNYEYHSILTIKSERTSILLGHGYKPRNPTKKSGSDKRKVTAIFVNESTYSYPWFGQLILKNE